MERREARAALLRRARAVLRERLPPGLVEKVRRLNVSYSWLIDMYAFDQAHSGAHTLSQRLRSMIHTTRRIRNRTRILFYPEIPAPVHVLYKVCLLLGHRVSIDPTKRFDIAVRWRDATFTPTDDTLSRLAGSREVLNSRCEDASKATVDTVFTQVFGYGLAINPRSHTGDYVRKSNLNAKHDGKIVGAPSEPEPDVVYQRVVNNEVDGGLVQDIRAPVFRSTIPFVYLKYRPIEKRFSNRNTRVELASVEDMFSHEEAKQIIRFCQAIGLDYGEIDILRDKEDGRLYIVDVNTTPSGPPNQLSGEGGKVALEKLALAFQAACFAKDTGKTPTGSRQLAG